MQRLHQYTPDTIFYNVDSSGFLALKPFPIQI